METPIISNVPMGVQYRNISTPRGELNNNPSIPSFIPTPYIPISGRQSVSSAINGNPYFPSPLLIQQGQFNSPINPMKEVNPFSPPIYMSMNNRYLSSNMDSLSLKRSNPYPSTYPSKYLNSESSSVRIPSSIEDLANQQLQRNEMDGILQPRTYNSPTDHQSYASSLVMNNAAWNVEDMTMLLFAMYRVLLQSRPDAPNELMIQIPVTCSTLLPSLLKLYIPSQLQNGNVVKEVMKHLALQLQQLKLPSETPFISNEVIIQLQKRRMTRIKNNQSGQDDLCRGDLIFALLDELNTSNLQKVFYLKEFLRCLFLTGISHADFIHSFTVFFYNHVEECIQYEQNCQIGELSQLIINTRNLQPSEPTHAESSESEDFRVHGLGFPYHQHLDYLMSFCSKYLIRPFPKTLFLSILNFFRTSIILSSFHSISKCIYAIILTQPDLATLAVRFLIRSWPTCDSSREVLYLRQIECILQIVSTEKQQVLFSMMFGTVKTALRSDNRFVSLQTIQLLTRIIQTNIKIIDRRLVPILADILNSLESHWCETIRQCSSSCIKTLLLKAELRSSGDENALYAREEALTG